ncbi:cofilin/actin-depolymerizing factor homolog [Drosophila pseudoobscura]|uniref:Cofilin/actin-depolymerizing factor homolog n=1 Tax=Drosophila pseudoobscura pseudoobscura TaxID=46245 RepID=B5DNP9_DROPS|nr:cofilin/actin-depolymerizing factor homolog [Drosophila pseudoobscura]
MMESGIQITRDSKDAFEEIWKKRTHRYAVFAVQENREIIVDALGKRDASYDDFLADLQGEQDEDGACQCRFAIYDFEYEHHFKPMDSSTSKLKLILVLWCPEQARIRDKMIYSSSMCSIIRAFIGVQKYIQANNLDDISREAVEMQLRAMDKD